MTKEEFAAAVSELIRAWDVFELYGLKPGDPYDVGEAKRIREDLNMKRTIVIEQIYKILYPAIP